MTAWRPYDLPAHFASGAMAAAPVSQASGHRWPVGGDADATPGSNGGSDTPSGVEAESLLIVAWRVPSVGEATPVFAIDDGPRADDRFYCNENE